MREVEQLQKFSKIQGLGFKELHVTNDLGERGIKILEDYKNILTENSKQRQMILHCVEKSRHDVPDFKKGYPSRLFFLKIELLTILK